MTTAPLKSRIIKATAWLIGGNVSSQMLRLISNLLLTRLLTPDAFGLVASVNTLYFGLVMFSDFGVWQSVVKSEDGTNPRFLGTAWSIQLLRGVLLCAVVLALSLGLHIAAGMGVFEANTAYADPRLPLMMASSPEHFFQRTRHARKVMVLDLGFLGDTVHLLPALWML